MKNSILLLIRDDIRLSRIVFNFEKLGIHAQTLLRDNLLVILSLLEIGKDEILSDEYYQMISKGVSIDNTAQQDIDLAEKIYLELFTKN
jgi:hypothetical protein